MCHIGVRVKKDTELETADLMVNLRSLEYEKYSYMKSRKSLSTNLPFMLPFSTRTPLIVTETAKYSLVPFLV